MYVYFDTQGIIREIISVDPARVGSSANKIYIYFENDPDLDHLWWVMKKPDDTTTTEADIVLNRDYKALPYDIIKDRDLKYFKDYETYNFYVLTLTTSDLSVSGLAELTLRAVIDDVFYAQGLLTFNIESSVIKYDNEITQSQYDYLLTQFGNLHDYGVVKKAIGNNTVSLTDDEMAECDKDFAIIIDTTTPTAIYVKQKVDSYNIYFARLHKNEYTGYADIVEGTMTVSLANKTVVRNTNTTSVYNKDKTDDLLSAKQDALVSGTNIKTLNENSLLGSGNIQLNDVGFITLSSDATEVSDEQLAEIQKDFCIIKMTNQYNVSYYYKYHSQWQGGDSYSYSFRIFPTIIDDTNYSKFLRYAIVVNSDKQITQSTSTFWLYSKSQVDSLISGLSNLSLKREIVSSLPVSDISTNIIYMVLDSAGQGANIYNEYLYINNNWELLGTSKLDYKLYDLGSTLTDRGDIITQLRNSTSQCVLKYTYGGVERLFYERQHQTGTNIMFFDNIFVGSNDITKYVLSNNPLVDGNSFTYEVHKFPYLCGLVGNYVSSKSYAVGDLICQGGKVYKCNTAHTSAFVFADDSAYWDETDLETLLTDNFDFKALDGSRVFYDGITKITDDVNKVWALRYNDQYYYRSKAYNSGYKANYFTNYDINYNSNDINEITIKTLSANNESDTFSFSEKVIYNYLHSLIAHFDTTATYSVGDIVNYSGKVWVCHTAITTAGSWTGTTNWAETNLAGLLNTKQDKLYKHVIGCSASNRTDDITFVFNSKRATAYDLTSFISDLSAYDMTFIGGSFDSGTLSNLYVIMNVQMDENDNIVLLLVDLATHTQVVPFVLTLIATDDFDDTVSEL